MPRNHTPVNRMICDWTGRKKFQAHHKDVKNQVEKRMKVENTNYFMNFKQEKWLESSFDLSTEYWV